MTRKQMSHGSIVAVFFSLVLQVVLLEALPDSSLRAPHLKQSGMKDSGAGSRRMAGYPERPTRDQLLQDPTTFSQVDVLASEAVQMQCTDFFVHGLPKENLFVVNLALNLTQFNVQATATHVDSQQKKVSLVVMYLNGTQSTYTRKFRTRSFGCALDDPKYNSLNTNFDEAQKVIDGLDYDAAKDFVVGPGIAPQIFKDFGDYAMNPMFNLTRAMGIYMFGQLVLERYGPGVDRNTILSDPFVYSQHAQGGVGTMWPAARALEGKLRFDAMAVAPELSTIDKRRRNMTIGNMLDLTVGRPLQSVVQSSDFDLMWVIDFSTKPQPRLWATPERALYDDVKAAFVVSDRANFAAVAPLAYTSANQVPFQWIPSKKDSNGWTWPLYQNVGTWALLQRELRYTFPGDSAGFTQYAAYPWTNLWSKLGARSMVVEMDASGTFDTIGMHATMRDFLKAGATMTSMGKWYGEQILPMEYVSANMNIGGIYGCGWNRLPTATINMLYYHAPNTFYFLWPNVDFAFYVSFPWYAPLSWKNNLVQIQFNSFVEKLMGALANMTVVAPESTTTSTATPNSPVSVASTANVAGTANANVAGTAGATTTPPSVPKAADLDQAASGSEATSFATTDGLMVWVFLFIFAFKAVEHSEK